MNAPWAAHSRALTTSRMASAIGSTAVEVVLPGAVACLRRPKPADPSAMGTGSPDHPFAVRSVRQSRLRLSKGSQLGSVSTCLHRVVPLGVCS